MPICHHFLSQLFGFATKYKAAKRSTKRETIVVKPSYTIPTVLLGEHRRPASQIGFVAQRATQSQHVPDRLANTTVWTQAAASCRLCAAGVPSPEAPRLLS